MWERFEDRKQKDCPVFAVTLVAGSGPSGMYLAFNQRIREQILIRHPWVDIFLDRVGKRIGLRFQARATDLHSYKIGQYKTRGSMARISATGFLKRWGLVEALDGRPYRAELKSDPAENMWWFSIQKLMNGHSTGVPSLRSGQAPIAATGRT